MHPVGGQSQVVRVQSTLHRSDEGVDHVVEGGGHQFAHIQHVEDHKGGKVGKQADKVRYGLRK